MLVEMFSTDEAAENWLVQRRLPHGVCCPEKSSFNVWTGRPLPRPAQEFLRQDRDADTRVEPGLKVWANAIDRLSANLNSVSSMTLSHDMDVTQKIASYLALHIGKM